MSRFIVIEYTNRGSIPPVYFPSINYVERLILEAGMLPSEEEVFEEGEEALHEFVPTFQRSIKKYTLQTAPISNSTLEEVHRLPMYDSVSVILQSGEKVRMRNIEVEHSYPFPDARLAMAEIRFDTGEVLTKTACCENMSKEEPITIVARWFNFVCHCVDGECDGWKRATRLRVNYGGVEQVFDMVGTIAGVSSESDVGEMTTNQYADAFRELLDIAGQHYGLTRPQLNKFVTNDMSELDEDFCPITEPPADTFHIHVQIIRSVNLPYVPNQRGLWGSVELKEEGKNGYIQSEYVPFPSDTFSCILVGEVGKSYAVWSFLDYGYLGPYGNILSDNVEYRRFYVSDEPKSLPWLIQNINLFTFGFKVEGITNFKYVYFLSDSYK